MKTMFKLVTALGVGLLMMILLSHEQVYAQAGNATTTSSKKNSGTRNEVPLSLTEYKPAAGKAEAHFQVNTVILTNSGKVKVALINKDREQVYIEIRDTRNELMYDEKHRRPAYIRDFDFSTAPSGIYTLVVRTKNQEHKREISVNYPTRTPLVQLHVPDSSKNIAGFIKPRIKNR